MMTSVLMCLLQDALGMPAESITCLVYLVGGSVAMGTSSGKIIVCCDAGPQCTVNINNSVFSTQGSFNCAGGGIAVLARQPQDLAASPSPGMMTNREGSIPPGSSSSYPLQPAISGVQAMVQRGRGFIVAGSLADVYMFEPPTTSSKSK
jgi:hypothetical protein